MREVAGVCELYTLPQLMRCTCASVHASGFWYALVGVVAQVKGYSSCETVVQSTPANSGVKDATKEADIVTMDAKNLKQQLWL